MATKYWIVDKETKKVRVSQVFNSMTEAAVYVIENSIEGCNVEPTSISEFTRVDDK